ncbi:Fpg/Nei family DNA glycosylase [Agromyces seonyuensis]|uniref:Fpg/Nei family DNA glycosylase n=1 Tax=Agromyces seonyuensis TaxID=2662446 RepID=A0A6I4P4E1_9MICO|nr:Fpg/Nei family DNA glycosylase [Agromyces seonyuensis]MWB98154.1 Fpg/Nei family DNA glycosylase [Agromyces seonyuensis]
MPELPEVAALAEYLGERASGRVIERVDVAEIAALKTYDPPVGALVGRTVVGAGRRGKFLGLDLSTPGDPLHLVVHLARAGWLRWAETQPTAPVRPGRSPIALRVRLDDGSGFDLVEYGSKKSLGVWVVRRLEDVPRIAELGPDPSAPEFGEAEFAGILSGRRHRIKGVLRDQRVLAGIGNAYSDEILHAARMSPDAIAGDLAPEDVARLYAAMRETLESARREASGKPAAELKDAKRRGMRVHGRTGEACPVCGDEVRRVVFADSEFQYCPTCQTGGTVLADRLRSRLVK